MSDKPRYQTPLEKEIRKVAFTNNIDLSDATRVVFHAWASRMRGPEIGDAFDFVFREDFHDNRCD